MEDVVKARDTLGRLHEACSELEADIHANVCDRARSEMASKWTFITTRLMVWPLPFPSTL
jgi:hypothetical protein